MAELRYEQIEQQIAEALPELRPAAEYYWETQGTPGSDCGPYIFFEDMFARYVTVLLAMPSSPRRDALLSRGFAFVEEMLGSADSQVRDLAFIGLYEGESPWWFARADGYIGPKGAAALDQWRSDWRTLADPSAEPRGTELLDGYGVRHVIAEHLRADGVTIEDVPGTTYEPSKRTGGRDGRA
jgi:hypothetical protein